MAVICRKYAEPGSGGEIAAALHRFFMRKQLCVPSVDIVAWARIGELYLSHFLSDVSPDAMRSEQYAIRDFHSALPLGCSDYDILYELLAGSVDAVGVCLHLPDSNGALHETWVDRQLVYEMFDFCRDGLG